MLKTRSSLLVMATLLGTLAVSPVEAATRSPAVRPYPTRIELNGKVLMNPEHTVFGESNSTQPTSWLPIWYLFQVLRQLGIGSSWNGQRWNLTLPTGIRPNGERVESGSPPRGDVSIDMSGSPVEFAPRIAHRDFSGKVMTSYIPIWYLMQALDLIGITSTWNGTTWSLTTANASTLVTKVQVVKDFVKTLHIALDPSGTNPFDDVSAADWPYVHAVLNKGYFTADNARHFGASDVVNVEAVDHAYQLDVGIPDSDLSWNAGGNTVAWADAVHLNQGVAKGSLSTAGEAQIMANLTALYRGYSKNADGSYRLWFQPYDARSAFAHNPNVNATIALEGQENSIQLADQVTFSVGNHGRLIFHLPKVSDQDKMEITCGSIFNSSGNHTEYSFNHGANWTAATGFYGYDSRDPNNGGVEKPLASVWVKSQGHAQVVVGEIFPNHDISFVLVDISPSPGAGTPVLRDSSGQPTWEG
ncbi:MAG: hypothetical protein ACYCYO_22300 [Bacilli bacterium]